MEEKYTNIIILEAFVVVVTLESIIEQYDFPKHWGKRRRRESDFNLI